MMKLWDHIIDKIFYRKIRQLSRENLMQKMISVVYMYTNALNTIEKEYGKEAIEKIHNAHKERSIQLGIELGMEIQNRSLRSFCQNMENRILLTHKWQKLEDSNKKQFYKFTYCMWAEVFRNLGAENIGFWICEGDGPAVKAYNPSIEFRRTKTLMMGDDYCDHCFFIKEKNNA